MFRSIAPFVCCLALLSHSALAQETINYASDQRHRFVVNGSINSPMEPAQIAAIFP